MPIARHGRVAERASSALVPITDKVIGGHEWAKVKDALQHISADCTYPEWTNVEMALQSTGHPEAFDFWIAGSLKAPHHTHDHDRFLAHGCSFNPNRANPVAIGSLFMLAKQEGWRDVNIGRILANLRPVAEVATPARCKLLSVGDVTARRPTKWRIKHVLPSTGAAAVTGQSGASESFLALDIAFSR